MTRQCFRCPKEATNLETAPIGCCDDCWDGIQEAILKMAKDGGKAPLTIVSPKEYIELEFLEKRIK